MPELCRCLSDVQERNPNCPVPEHAAQAARDEVLDALAELHGCVAWSDSMQQFHFIGNARTVPALNKAREVLEKHGRRVF